ncbi:unnamed protein product [Rotaria sp. Silwood2]|nr:unnamed protein product [Rotaria sp. Silwood2]
MAPFTFTLFAPYNKQAALRLKNASVRMFGVDILMEKDESNGYFRATVDLADGIFHYQFKIQTKSWFEQEPEPALPNYDDDEYKEMTQEEKQEKTHEFSKLIDEIRERNRQRELESTFTEIWYTFVDPYATDVDERGTDYCLKAINIREKILPMNHPYISDNCNNVALISHHLHKYEKALNLFQRSLQIHENDYDQKMRIPICLNNIGRLCLDQHQYDQAIEYYFKALETSLDLALDYYYQKALNNSETSPSDLLSSVFMSMGIVYHRQHQYDLVLEIYKHALYIRKHLLSNFDLDLVWT